MSERRPLVVDMGPALCYLSGEVQGLKAAPQASFTWGIYWAASGALE